MYCSKCGKKLNEDMLFCPFCGTAIVIPEQSGEDGSVQLPEAENEPKTPHIEFRPLQLDIPEPVKPAEEDAPEETPEKKSESAERPASERPRHGSGSSGTRIPPKPISLDDMFLDDEDDGDDYDDDDDDDDDAGEYEFEDDDEGSFFERHIRGIVGIILFLILLVLVAIYAVSDSGQKLLARHNLAWDDSAYENLAKDYSAKGFDCYMNGQYEEAGAYYEKALEYDADNYDYASTAANAYVTANKPEKAIEMLKRMIAIDPTRVEPYVYLKQYYPDAAQRPADIAALLEQGYQQTGEASLKD